MQNIRRLNYLGRLLLESKNVSLQRYQSGGLYEPSYLEAMKSKIPLYDRVNILMKGYDYAVLEHYQKFIHNLLKNMEVEVEDAWAVPAQELNVTVFKPKSELVNAQYSLKLYERVVQMTDITSIQLPLVIRAVEASLPSGVQAEIRPHQELDEEIRYIPDLELNTLKQELEDLGGPSKQKK